MTKELSSDDALADKSRQAPTIMAKQTRQPSRLAKKALEGAIGEKVSTRPIPSKTFEKVERDAVVRIQTPALAEPFPSSESAAAKIQAFWRNTLERRRQKRQIQCHKIIGMCSVGSRLAKIFEAEALECDDSQECLALGWTNAATYHSEMGSRLAKIFKEETLEFGQAELPIGSEPVKTQGNSAESRSAKTFMTESSELTEFDRLSQIRLFQTPKGGQGKRAASPDSSTSAGTTSESEDESASEWMTQEAWRPPPGLRPWLARAPGFKPEILDPWGNQVF